MNGQDLAWLFTTLSNTLWLFVFIPQFYNNYKIKNAEAISLSLLFCLLLGDILSIISASAKHLNIIIIYAGIYHVVLDLIMIFQILYYRRQKCLSRDQMIIEETIPLIGVQNSIVNTYDFYILTFRELFFITTCFVFILSSQLLIQIHFIADMIGWVATFIFMFARIPQIILNHDRKSTTGLSLLSFIIMNIANIFFLLSVLILLIDIDTNEHYNYIKYNIQWIVGSSSTNIFDAIIFYQFYIYNKINDNL
jgi:uncharacterized protein with PQ loop repeat